MEKCVSTQIPRSGSPSAQTGDRPVPAIACSAATCPRPSKRSGFTLLELLTSVAVIGILFTIVAIAAPRAIDAAKKAQSSSNLRQLGLAVHMYLMDHDDAFFPYRRDKDDGVIWYFGFEPAGSARRGEGERELDRTRSPLYPYVRATGGIEVCPGFDYHSALWKPKFRGASWGYGYNLSLGPMYYGNGDLRRPGKSLNDLSTPSQVVVFGTSAQVNTFQEPASPENPMLEEFYFIDDTHRTVHFRFGGGRTALFLFADGNVSELPPHPGTLDERLPKANVGRITPRGSRKYLE